MACALRLPHVQPWMQEAVALGPLPLDELPGEVTHGTPSAESSHVLTWMWHAQNTSFQTSTDGAYAAIRDYRAWKGMKEDRVGVELQSSRPTWWRAQFNLNRAVATHDEARALVSRWARMAIAFVQSPEPPEPDDEEG